MTSSAEVQLNMCRQRLNNKPLVPHQGTAELEMQVKLASSQTSVLPQHHPAFLQDHGNSSDVLPRSKIRVREDATETLHQPGQSQTLLCNTTKLQTAYRNTEGGHNPHQR